MDFGHDDLTRNFGQIWPVHVEHFTELLIALRQQFGGDLDRMLVLAIIGTRTLPHRRVHDLSYAEFMDGGVVDPHPNPINVQSISDYSGIPRETVRRKVLELEQLGWVEKHESGYLVVSKRAAGDLSPVTAATFKYLVAVGAACVKAASPLNALSDSDNIGT